MKKSMLKCLSACLVTAVAVIMFSGCSGQNEKLEENKILEEFSDVRIISMNGDSATIDGVAIEESDYTWYCDPSVVHDEVKDAPAEYYSGTKPYTDEAAYIDHELYYYPNLDTNDFKLVNYDGEQEWAYYYTDGENNDYIFATLPALGSDIPTQMMHTKGEAAENKVLHITEPGNYVLTGSWKGQVSIDLGEDAFADESAKVNIILNNADINCSVAPGIVFYNVYECDNEWEARTEYSADVDTKNAGAVITIADGSENSVTGTNIFRMLKTKYKDEDSTDKIKVQKKMRKLDGALYSYMSMNIEGNDGKLTVNGGFEGIDSELHLSVNGGDIVINSGDDGMNVNEDHVSVIGFYGGKTTINPAQGTEGDGVDSNGFIKIDGGELVIDGVRAPDSALDSEDGIYYVSGKVTIDGTDQDYSEGDVFRESGRTGGGQPFGGRGGMFPGEGQDGRPDMPPGQAPDMPFGDRGPEGGPFGGMREDFDITDFKEKVANLSDDATFQDVMELLRR